MNAAAGLAATPTASHTVVSAYLGQLDEAAAHSNGSGVRDLADELAEAGKPGSGLSGGRAALILHLEVVHRLAKAALVGKLDPVVASSAAEMLIGSLLDRIGGAATGARANSVGPQLAAAVMGQTSRYLAWLASTSLGRHLFKDGVLYCSSEPYPMCLTACYWARIPRLVFAATSYDVATYGFEDLQFYRELTYPADKRQLQEDSADDPLRQDAAAVLGAWVGQLPIEVEAKY